VHQDKHRRSSDQDGHGRFFPQGYRSLP
jgi:hypothetical protein